MAYVAVPNMFMPSSQSVYSISFGSSKYAYRGQRLSHDCGGTYHRSHENALGSWGTFTSTLLECDKASLDSHIKIASGRINPIRRVSHSLDTRGPTSHKADYTDLSNYSVNKSRTNSYRDRTSSQSNIESTARLAQTKRSNLGYSKLPYCTNGKQMASFASLSTLHKYSSPYESSILASRPYNWRNARNFRNTSKSPATKEPIKSKKLSLQETFSEKTSERFPQYSSDDLASETGFISGDVLKSRYQIIQEIGRGSFGRVYKVTDTQTGKTCALKCIKDIMNFRKLANEEISILLQLTQQDKHDKYNFLHLNDHFSTQDCVFMVFDLLSINLFQLIHRNNYRGFAPKLVRKFARCILNCLQFIHRNKIIHCDLKPENILMERPGYTNVKVIDFGSSCHFGQNLYTYIQSRFYRAPEVIFGSEYEAAIDMWSFGCIIGELLTGSPIFPGEDERDQVACIMEVLGLPPASVRRKVRRPHHFFTDDGEPRYIAERANRLQHRQGYHGPGQLNRADPGALSLEAILKNSLGHDGTDSNLVDFLNQCLRWDPKERMTASEALRHPWIQGTEASDLDNTTASTRSRSSSIDK